MADFLAAIAASAGSKLISNRFFPVVQISSPGRSRGIKSAGPFCSRRTSTPSAPTIAIRAPPEKWPAVRARRVRHERFRRRHADCPLRTDENKIASAGDRNYFCRPGGRGKRAGRFTRAAARGFKADLAIVGEPTRLQVVTAHKGSLWLGLETRGKAAHGATPQLGRNAVHEMARIVDVLETSYAARLRKRKHPLLGMATVNVGMICGGTSRTSCPTAARLRLTGGRCRARRKPAFAVKSPRS